MAGALVLSGALVVLLVAVAGLSVGAGLGLLAVLDIVIVGGGYALIRRNARAGQ